MDEQNDQAVLELEEIETDMDYDYLSILREMQQSLSGDEESAEILKAVSDEADLPSEATRAAAASTIPSGAPETVSASDEIHGENDGVQTADYFADAPTQPLPELPAEFNNHNFNTESLSAGTEAEPRPAAEANLNDSAVANEYSSLATDSLETVSRSSVEENLEKAAEVNETDDSSFDDFAELSPILFDANEAAGITEPDFDSELSVESPFDSELLDESPAEMTPPETATNNLSVDYSERAQALESEAVAESELSSAADEMPTSLAFSELFGTDSEELETAFAPPVEFSEETEAETAPLPQPLETGDFASTESLGEPAPPTFEQKAATPNLSEQNFSEQGLATEFGSKSDELPMLEEDSSDLALPDLMFPTEAESRFNLDTALALLETELQEKESTKPEMTEPDLSETPSSSSSDSEENNLGLSVPWFLQEELATKHSLDEENFPEPFFAEDNFTGEAATTELATEPDEMPVAPPVAENNPETNSEVENSLALPETTVSKNGFGRHLSAEEADAISETSSFDSETVNVSEAQYPENLPENFLATALANEVEVAPDILSDEIPEALLLKDSETPRPESDAVGFDVTPEPEFEDGSVTAADSEEPPPDSSLIGEPSEPKAATQNSLPEKYYQLGKASFLEERFVIFKLDDTLYAFPAVNVAEIGQLLPITPLPFVPSWFLGITHLRGDIVSVVGLRELWQKNTVVPQKAKILIVHSEKQSLTIALVVDAVREMRHVAPEEIVSGVSQNESHFAPYQIGTVDYDGQNLCLLNAEKLLETLRS